MKLRNIFILYAAVVGILVSFFSSFHVYRLKITASQPDKEIILEYHTSDHKTAKISQITGTNKKTEFLINEKYLKNFKLFVPADTEISEVVLKASKKEKLSVMPGLEFNVDGVSGSFFLSKGQLNMALVFAGALCGILIFLQRNTWQKAEIKQRPLQNVEFLRVFFTVGVVCFHFFGQIGLWNNGGQGVEFFFILSGYFLALTFNQDTKLLDFAKQKFIRWVPLIVFGGFLSGGYLSCFKGMFFVQNTGLYGEIANPPAWYLGVLFWVLLFYFAVAKVFDAQKRNLIIGSLAFFACIVVFQSQGDRLETVLMYIPRGMFRGLGMVGAGFVLASVCVRDNHAVAGSRIYSFVELMITVVVLSGVFFKIDLIKNGVFQTIGHIMLIWLFVQKRGMVSDFFEKRIWTALSKYCLAIYLTHFSVVGLIWTFPQYHIWVTEHKISMITGVLLCSFGLGVAAHHLIEKPMADLLKKKMY